MACTLTRRSFGCKLRCASFASHSFNVRLPMNIFGIVIFFAAFILIGYAYYLMENIAYAIWFPNRVSAKWAIIAEYPPVQIMPPLFKWLVPVWIGITVMVVVLVAAERTLRLVTS